MINSKTAPIEKRLLAFARPELYRTNAFRVLGLPLKASDREIARRVQEIELSLKFGGSINADIDALALDPPPSNDEIREASQRLKDPATRFLDEFFWPGISKMLGQTLAKGDNQAIKIWLDQDMREAADGEGEALHNLAVLTHLRVLDLELLAAAQPLGDSLVRYRDEAWDNVYRYWTELLWRESFWQAAANRIRELNDPRLPSTFASDLRAALPSLVLTINAQLAIRAADSEESDDVDRHARLIYAADFDDEVVEQVLRRAIAPVRERLTLLCRSAETQTTAEPMKGKQAVVELLNGSRPVLSLFDALFEVDSLVSADSFDLVARTALNCLHDYGRQSRDWKGILPLLEAIASTATSDSLVSQIRESLKVVKENAEFKEVEPLFSRTQAIMESKDSLAAKAALLQYDIAPNVREVEARLSDDSETFESLSNMLAGALRAISVDLHNEEDNYDLAHQTILLAREFAIDPELRKKIEADLVTVREHAEHEEILKDLKPIKKAPELSTINGIGQTLYGQSNYESKLHSYLTTLYFVILGIPILPLARYRVIDTGENSYRFLGKAPLRRKDKWHIAAFAVLVLAVVVWIGVASQTSTSSTEVKESSAPYSSTSNNSRSSNSNSNNFSNNSRSLTNISVPRPSPSIMVKEQLAPVDNSSDNYRNADAERLKAEIEQANDSLDSLKSELDSLTQEVSSYKTQIDRYASIIKKMERDNELGYSVDQYEYERALRNHNTNVDLYNSKIAERREKASEYNQLLAETNSKINRYNKIIRGGP